jgi:hypothetical protein
LWQPTQYRSSRARCGVADTDGAEDGTVGAAAFCWATAGTYKNVAIAATTLTIMAEVPLDITNMLLDIGGFGAKAVLAVTHGRLIV